MVGQEPQKATVSQERSEIVVEQLRLEAWKSLLIDFNLVEVLPLGTIDRHLPSVQYVGFCSDILGYTAIIAAF